jgi:hypothetical protein
VTLLRFAAVASLTVAALCAVGTWPTLRLAGEDGLLAMGLAAGVSLAGALAGWIPLARLSSPAADPTDRANAVLAGLAVRLAVTLGGVLVVLLSDAVAQRGAFLVWLGVDYFALLLVETRSALRSIDPHSAVGGTPRSADATRGSAGPTPTGGAPSL